MIMSIFFHHVLPILACLLCVNQGVHAAPCTFFIDFLFSSSFSQKFFQYLFSNSEMMTRERARMDTMKNIHFLERYLYFWLHYPVVLFILLMVQQTCGSILIALANRIKSSRVGLMMTDVFGTILSIPTCAWRTV